MYLLATPGSGTSRTRRLLLASIVGRVCWGVCVGGCSCCGLLLCASNKQQEIISFRSMNYRIRHSQGQIIPEFQNSRIPDLQDRITPEFQNSRIPDLQDQIIPEFQNSRIPDLQDRIIPEFQNSRIPDLQDQIIPEFQNSRIPEFQICKVK